MKYLTGFGIFFLAVAVCLTLLQHFTQVTTPQPIQFTEQVLIDGHLFTVEMATNNESREIGLMFRKNLAANKGMLFIFDKPAHQAFWMKNTLIPLDILFFNNQGTLLGVAANTPICTKDPCGSVDGGAAVSQWVLELKAGTAARLGFQVGKTHLVRESQPTSTPTQNSK